MNRFEVESKIEAFTLLIRLGVVERKANDLLLFGAALQASKERLGLIEVGLSDLLLKIIDGAHSLSWSKQLSLSCDLLILEWARGLFNS